MKIVKTVAAVLAAVALASPALADEPSSAASDQTPVKQASTPATQPEAQTTDAGETKKPVAELASSNDESQTAEGHDSETKPTQS